MKRLSSIAMAALALVLTFTQCKKEVAEQPAAENRVFITVKGNLELNDEEQNDERMTINDLGLVWSEGCTEYVYVGGSAHNGCIGVLHGEGTGNGSIEFEGYINGPIDGEVLYYFYLGRGDERTGDSLNILDFSYQEGDPTASSTSNGLEPYIVAIAAAIYYQGTAYYVLPFSLQTAFARFDRDDLHSTDNYYVDFYANIIYPPFLYGDDIWTTATVDYQHGKIVGRTKGTIMCWDYTNRTPTIALIPSTTNMTTLHFIDNKRFGDITFYRGIQPGKFYMHDDASALKIEGQEITDMPLTFEAKTATAQVLFYSTYFGSGYAPDELDLEYKINDGEWESYPFNEYYPQLYPINLEYGDKVSFRGNNKTMAGYVFDGVQSEYLENSSFVCLNGECYFYGNVMSLLFKDEFAEKNYLPVGSSYTFCKLFKVIEGFDGFYSHPTLPLMLPAMALRDDCYSNMFYGCTHLTKAPELPSTSLARNCYQYMFKGCTSLTTAPFLGAVEEHFDCYAGMFKGCSNLNFVRCLTRSNPFVPGQGHVGDFGDQVRYMLEDVAPTGTFVMDESIDETLWDGIIPEGWNIYKMKGMFNPVWE
jgi:hypothetical protein